MARINITAIRRTQIVDAAIQVMAEKGWNETSIDEVTRTAGVSRGLVSYHFKDKADLLSGVLSRCREIFNETVSAAATVTSEPVERMRLIVRAAIAMTRENPVSYQVFLHFAANGPAQPELGEQIRLLYADFRAYTAAGIRSGQRRGLFRADLDPDATAAQVIGAIIGLALQWLVDPEGYPFDAAARQAEAMLMDYLTDTAAGAASAPPSIRVANG